MRIHVLCFAGARDAVGRGEFDLDLDAGATVGSARAALLRAHPALRPGATSLRFAVNEAFADDAQELRPGDTLAVIPPVSGG